MFRKTFVAAAVSLSVFALGDPGNPKLHAQEADAGQRTKEIAPRPENRLHSYCANRSRRWLKQQKSLPDALPPCPGWTVTCLDIGPSRSLDAFMGDVDFGGRMSTVIGHFRKITTKAVIVQPGDSGDMISRFDPTQLSFIDVWEEPLTTFSPAMLGLIPPATKARGDQLINLQASKWNAPEDTEG